MDQNTISLKTNSWLLIAIYKPQAISRCYYGFSYRISTLEFLHSDIGLTTNFTNELTVKNESPHRDLRDRVIKTYLIIFSLSYILSTYFFRSTLISPLRSSTWNFRCF